ncbi:MAG: hypothetical protein ABIQ66_10730 [Novosphingobium sp.]
MFYDTHYRHNEALHPDALTTVTNALQALNAGVEDCRRAGKSPERDAAILLLIRNLADVADCDAPSPAQLRIRCALDRRDVIASPALLDIAGGRIADNYPAKRTFHYQARRALYHLVEAIGIDPDSARINSALGNESSEGTTELHHDVIGIRVVPRGFLPECEISFWRCRDGQCASKVYSAPIAELLDAPAFEHRLTGTIGCVRAAPLAIAA